MESNELQAFSFMPSLGPCRVPHPEDAEMGNRHRPKKHREGKLPGQRGALEDHWTAEQEGHFGRWGWWTEGKGGFPEEVVLEQL